jgi:hypothetical protein
MNQRRLQLTLILAAFLLPAIIALLLQTRWFHWEPESTKNRGQLISPVVALAPAELLADGHRWSVVVRFPIQCDANCEQRLTLLSRIREASGKEMDRVQMVAWVGEQRALASEWSTRWQPATDALVETVGVPEAGVMLVDPLGNAMMRYSADADPTDVRKDLAHLLRWSTVGK